MIYKNANNRSAIIITIIEQIINVSDTLLFTYKLQDNHYCWWHTFFIHTFNVPKETVVKPDKLICEK